MEDGEHRETWIALSELIPTAVPKGDNDALLTNLRKRLEVERWTTRPSTWGQWLEPVGVLAAIAGVVVLAAILSLPETPAPIGIAPIPVTADLAWEDGFEASFAAVEEEALSWSESPSIALEFEVVEQEIKEVKESIASEKL